MKKPNFMSVAACSLKYNLNENTLFVRRCNGSLPKDIFISKKGLPTYIDESYISRRVEFRKKIIKTIQEAYYELSESMNDNAIATALHKIDTRTSKDSWANFIYRDMFRTREPNRLLIKVHKKEWKFFKYSKLILRGLR